MEDEEDDKERVALFGPLPLPPVLEDRWGRSGMRKASILLETSINRPSVSVITSNSSNSLRGVLSSKMNVPPLRACDLGRCSIIDLIPGDIEAMPFGVTEIVRDGSTSITPSFQRMMGSSPLLGRAPSVVVVVGGD